MRSARISTVRSTSRSTSGSWWPARTGPECGPARGVEQVGPLLAARRAARRIVVIDRRAAQRDAEAFAHLPPHLARPLIGGEPPHDVFALLVVELRPLPARACARRLRARHSPPGRRNSRAASTSCYSCPAPWRMDEGERGRGRRQVYASVRRSMQSGMRRRLTPAPLQNEMAWGTLLTEASASRIPALEFA